MAFRINLSIIFLLVLFLYGCKPVGNVLGSYAHRINQTGVESYTLTIKADSSFSVVAQSDVLLTNTISGKWKIKGRRLLLAEDSPLVAEPFLKMQQSYVKGDTAVRIHILDAEDNAPLVAAAIEVNGLPFTYNADSTGTVIITGQFELKKIKLSYVSIEENIIFKDTTTNNVTIFVDFNKVPSLKWVIVPKQMRINGHSLIPVYEGRADRSAELVKTN